MPPEARERFSISVAAPRRLLNSFTPRGSAVRACHRPPLILLWFAGFSTAVDNSTLARVWRASIPTTSSLRTDPRGPSRLRLIRRLDLQSVAWRTRDSLAEFPYTRVSSAAMLPGYNEKEPVKQFARSVSGRSGKLTSAKRRAYRQRLTFSLSKACALTGRQNADSLIG